jgi:hypothetical protein
MNPQPPSRPSQSAGAAEELTGVLREAVEQLQATHAPRDLAARGIERAAAWPPAKAAPAVGIGRRPWVWVVAAAAAVVALAAVGAGGVVCWVVWKTPGDDTPQAAAPTTGNNQNAADCFPAKPEPRVKVVRLPPGASHPRAVLGKEGLHLVYFMGDPRRGDVFYVGAAVAEKVDFSKPVRVNSQPGSACMADPGCGLQFMVDRFSGQVHVVWSGPPDGAGADGPVYYTRLLEKGGTFEPQRNLAGTAGGRGPAIAAHASMVCVFWHAPAVRRRVAGNRLVWLAKSFDGGKTLAEPRAVSPGDIDVCPNCPLCATETNPGMPVLVYRGATDPEHRDTYLLYDGFWEQARKGAGFQNDKYHNVKLHAWKTATCPATTAAVLEVHNGYLAVWETAGQIYYARVPGGTGKFAPPVTVPGKTGYRKHPAACFDGRDLALVWIETAGKETSVCWQLFNHQDEPTPERGAFRGAPSGSRPVVVPTQFGSFLVIY